MAHDLGAVQPAPELQAAAGWRLAGPIVDLRAALLPWTAQHQYGGALLGEHVGQLLAIGWSVTLSIIVLRRGLLPRWVGVVGLVTSALYLANQGDILATAVPGFPVFDLVGAIGSTSWGLWVAALGVAVLRLGARPAPVPAAAGTLVA